MAQEQKPIKRFKPTFVEEAPQPKQPESVLGGILRASGERARAYLPTGLRVASMFPKAGPIGAVIAGSAEAAAEKLEGQPLNPGKIAVEAGMGLLPIKFFMEAGKAGISALKGAATSTAATVARKAAGKSDEETYTEAVRDWGLGDVIPTVAGGAMSGLLGKFSKAAPKATPTTPTPHGPETLSDFLSTKKWDANRIKLEAAKMESRGDKEAATRLREAARDTDTGDASIYDAITKAHETKSTGTVKAKVGASKAQQQAMDLVAKEKEKAAKLAEQARLKAEKATQVETRKAGLVPKKTTATETVSTETPEGVKESVTTVFGKPGKKDAGKGGKPLGPKGGSPTAYRLVNKQTRATVEFESAEDLKKALEELGPEKAQNYLVFEPEVPSGTSSSATHRPSVPETQIDPVTGKIRPPSGVAAGKAGKKAAKEGSVLDQADKIRAAALKGTPGEVVRKMEAGTPEPFNPPRIEEEPPPMPAPVKPPKVPKGPKGGAAAKVPGAAETPAPFPKEVGSLEDIAIEGQKRAAAKAANKLPDALRKAMADAGATPETIADVEKAVAKGPVTPEQMQNEVEMWIRGKQGKGKTPTAEIPTVKPAVTPKNVEDVIIKPKETTPPVKPPQAPPAAAAPIAQAPAKATAEVEAEIEKLLQQYPEDVYAQIGPLSKAYNVAVANARKLKAEGAPQAAIDLANTARAEIATKMARITGQAELDGKIPQGFAAKITQSIRNLRKTEGPRSVGAVKGSQKAVEGLKVGGKAQTPPAVPSAPVETPVAPQTPSSASPKPISAAPIADALVSEPPQLTTKEVVGDLEKHLDAINKRLFDAGNNPNIDPRLKDSVVNELMEVRRGLQDKLRAAQVAAKNLGKGSRFSGEKGEINPELAQLLFTKVAPTAAGALVGGAVDQEDPVRGAAIGAAAGYGGGRLLGNLPKADTGKYLTSLIPQAYRFNLLSDPISLGINAGLAPLGSGIMGSAELALTGAVNKGLARIPALQRFASTENADNLRQGLTALREIFSTQQIKNIPGAWNKAVSLLNAALERGDYQSMSQARNNIQRLFSLPGTMMTAGDELMREALGRAGISEDVARLITLTHNPRSRLGTGVTSLVKNNPVAGGVVLPFSRTATNIIEGAAERIPLLGWLPSKILENPEFQATLAQHIAREGLGAATVYVAYQIGATADPDTAKQYRLAKLVSNMGGQYAALAGAGFAAGMSSQLGTNPEMGAITDLLRGVPFPATEEISEFAKSVSNLAREGEAHPAAEYAPQRYLPNAMVPGFLRDPAISNINEFLNPPVKRFKPTFPE